MPRKKYFPHDAQGRIIWTTREPSGLHRCAKDGGILELEGRFTYNRKIIPNTWQFRCPDCWTGFAATDREKADHLRALHHMEESH